MLWKYISISVAIFSTIILSSTFFPTVGTAQNYPVCFMLNSSRQIINLNKLCRNQLLEKAKACQGPFDADGFPIALATELENFKMALKSKTVQEVEGDQIYAEADKLLDQVYFSNNTQVLRRKLRLANEQMLQAQTVEKFAQAYEEYGIALEKLKAEPCYALILKSLGNKSLLPDIILPMDLQPGNMDEVNN